MPKKRTLSKINRSDYDRALLTETTPFETPIIFSNDGLYKNLKDKDSLGKIFKFITDNLVTLDEDRHKTPTTPYSYKVRKNALEFRKLSLMHPILQWQIKEFYKKYEKLICHYCSKSIFTIRAPSNPASTFYYKSSWEDLNQYKRGSINENITDTRTKHSSSFFSYKGHDRLYKFFNSEDFIGLEKKYTSLWSMDVSKCFDSIYTHSISWATKDKQYTKQNLQVSSTFGDNFDSLIRRANQNETNGILIGPEVSRIFAEIIFQSIDTKALTALEKRGLIAGTDFEIRRYVDDIFIFSKGEEISIKIHETYSDCLSKFNLSTNSSKTKKLSRPFLTEKSKIIREINISVNEFNEKFLSQPSESNKLLPKKIFRKEKLIHHFIDSIKSICLANEATYDDVSSYIISALFERTKKIINIEKELSQDNEHALKESCLVILETMAFFYSVSPSVSSSYKYCAAIILLNRFSEKFLPNYKHSIKQKAFSLSESLLTSDLAKSRANIDNFVFLEAINILLAISELGDEYLLPAATIEKFYTTEKSYYDIITTLFYIKSNIRYKSIRHRLIKEIDKKLRTNSDIRSDAEKACLFMDALSCPYISKSQKLKWIAAFYSDLKSALPSNQDIGIFFVESQSRYWFVNWSEIDLLNALEKKELKRSY